MALCPGQMILKRGGTYLRDAFGRCQCMRRQGFTKRTEGLLLCIRWISQYGICQRIPGLA